MELLLSFSVVLNYSIDVWAELGFLEMQQMLQQMEEKDCEQTNLVSCLHDEGNAFNTFVGAPGFTQYVLMSNSECKQNFCLFTRKAPQGIFWRCQMKDVFLIFSDWKAAKLSPSLTFFDVIFRPEFLSIRCLSGQNRLLFFETPSFAKTSQWPWICGIIMSVQVFPPVQSERVLWSLKRTITTLSLCRFTVVPPPLWAVTRGNVIFFTAVHSVTQDFIYFFFFLVTQIWDNFFSHHAALRWAPLAARRIISTQRHNSDRKSPRQKGNGRVWQRELEEKIAEVEWMRV